MFYKTQRSPNRLSHMTKIRLTDLHHDVMLHVLSYLTASDLDIGLSLTTKSLHQECSCPKLWKDLCERTGKSEGILVSGTCDSLFDLYHQIPCVPQDFASIAQALDFCPPGGTITLLPGVYQERVVIRNSVRIRAAHPRQGAAIVLQGGQDHSAIEIKDSCTYVSLQHLNILHFSRGCDIWNGNCAVYCHGNLTHTVMDGCSIQSDSGRGLVVTNGASLKLIHSTVHDCAATGLYVGDMDSLLDVANCNILRNGFGPPQTIIQGEEDFTPSGHSGLYVEAAEAEIRNTFLADNCLTGLSVVQQGTVHISDSDVTGNGEQSIVVFGEANYSHEAEGGVYEYSNNFENPPDGIQTIRCAHVPNKFLSKSALERMYDR